jgi:hypothetical protein
LPGGSSLYLLFQGRRDVNADRKVQRRDDRKVQRS